MIRPSNSYRFGPASLFRPGCVAVLGAAGEQGGRVMRNLEAGGFHGTVLAAMATGLAGRLEFLQATTPPRAPDLAVLCEGGGDPETVLPALAASGVFACLVMAEAVPPGELRRLAELTGVRSLGPGSYGLAVPAIGLDVTLGHLRPRPGRLALVSQSSALCRTVLDWAAPNGVGFSHIVGVGSSDDIDCGLPLDWLSRDAGTGAILLDLRRVQNARRFLSAARAAARLRPVVAIRAGGRVADASGGIDATLAAALHRVGVVCVDSLEDLLGAAETLTRAKPVRGERLAIVGNAIGPSRMAADAALRDGLDLADEQPIHVALAQLADAAGRAAEKPGVGGVLVVHAPEGEGDAEALAQVAAAAAVHASPWLVCALGEATGAERRRVLAAAGLATFAGPGAAVRAFKHLVQDRRGREAARELPSADILDLRPDRARVEQALSRVDLAAILDEYGVVAVPAPPGVIKLAVASDELFGPVLSVGSALTGDPHDQTFDLPPLNLTLAHAMVGRSALVRGLAARLGAAVTDKLADTLVRVSALVVDHPALMSLQFDPCAPNGGGLRLHPPGSDPPSLALPPYPSELVGWFDAGGERLTIRPIRPEDADAHAALFARLPAEDVRRRFFAELRQISAEQVVRMTQIDYEREMAFVAVRQLASEATQTVGVARLVRETLLDQGEFAVLVQPDMKGKGVARHLMERLIEWGRAQGLDCIVGEILRENHPMRAFAEGLGFTLRMTPDDPEMMEARLDLRGGT